jgi:hypothetical protein
MTINEAIKRLTALRNLSSLGGDTVLTVCLEDDSGYEYMEVSDLTIDSDPDGALCLVRVSADNHGF